MAHNTEHGEICSIDDPIQVYIVGVKTGMDAVLHYEVEFSIVCFSISCDQVSKDTSYYNRASDVAYLYIYLYITCVI